MSHHLRHCVLAGATLVLLGHCASPAKSPAASKIQILGRDGATLQPAQVSGEVINDPLSFDVVVVGGGVAGMTSALYLTDAGKRVLLLERGPSLEKLSTWSEGQNHIRYGRSAGNLADTSLEFVEILKHIGAPARKLPLPMDSYLLASDLYTDLWSPATATKLPGGFSTFERELRAAVEARKVPVPPFENFALFGGSMDLDGKSARTWIQSMARTDGAMDDVIEFADIYCRSQLGAASADVSAMLFASAIASELEASGVAVHRASDVLERMARTLEERAQVFWGKTGAAVSSIHSRPEGVEVVYGLDGGKMHRVRAKFVVYAQQLKFAPSLIEGYERLEPGNADWMKRLAYAHVLEHRLETQGALDLASIRTWIHSTESDVSALLVDPQAPGLIVNEPLLGASQSDLANANVEEHAGRVNERVSEWIRRLMPEAKKEKSTVAVVSTTRWPLGLHSSPPGTFTQSVESARKPFERVFFASQDLGAPFFEEALFRGHCAAVNVLVRINRSYRPEKWSRCPIEKTAPVKAG